ncbi:type II 3-dehydroquinate dehydratase [bacterium]|nr:type II 3-dehydroquinate dehydratase [bacterium]
MSPVIHVLNGPNMDRLGLREPDLYGRTTYAELTDRCQAVGRELGLDVVCRQSAHEGDLVDWLHQADAEAAAVILNAAAYTHTSVAVRDAVSSLSIPVVEVHVTNPHAREDFRRRNLLSDVVWATLAGFGPEGYELALRGLAARLAADG